MVSLRVRPVILLFGDSLTQLGFGENGGVGWASLVASAYIRRADVLNRGFSGYNTRHSLDVLERVLGGTAPQTTEQSVLFGTVFLGANDAALPGEPQHVPIDEYAENLAKIVTTMRERIDQGGSSQVPIFLLTPPPVDEPTWAKVLDREASDRHNRVAREYGERAKKVGEELGCHVVDVFDLLGGTTDDYAKHLSDGLHLSDSGNKLLGEALLSLICKNYPQLAPLEHEDREKGVGMLEEEAHFSELI